MEISFFQSIEGDVIPRVSSADVRIENRFGFSSLSSPSSSSSVVENSRESVNGEDCNLKGRFQLSVPWIDTERMEHQQEVRG